MKKFKKPNRDSNRPARSDSRRPPVRAASPAQQSTPRGRAVVGIHAVTEVLKVRPRSVTTFWLREGYEKIPQLANLAEAASRARVRVTAIPPGALDKPTSGHQGVAAFSDESPELDLRAISELPKATLVVLDEVEDPHNLGAVLRTAWLLGANGLLLPDNRAATLNATVSKVAQGAVEHVPVMQESGLLETLKHLKTKGFWMYGLSHRGTQSIFKTEVPEKIIWVLGSESSGIRKPIERECDQLVQIPQSDPDASFNVSVAAAIALAETARSRI